MRRVSRVIESRETEPSAALLPANRQILRDEVVVDRVHIDARHLARRDNLVRHAEQEEARRILQHKVLNLAGECKAFLGIRRVAHPLQEAVNLGVAVVTDVLLTGRAERLIQIPERIICAERDPVALRQVEVTLRLCLLGVLDAADRRLDARLLELVLQSLVDLDLLPHALIVSSSSLPSFVT